MNSYLKKLKDDFLKKHELTFRSIYLSDSENKEILKEYKKILMKSGNFTKYQKILLEI